MRHMATSNIEIKAVSKNFKKWHTLSKMKLYYLIFVYIKKAAFLHFKCSSVRKTDTYFA